MSNDNLIWLNEAEIAELVDLDDAIEALETGLALEARERAYNVPKALGVWGDGSSMHALGSMFPKDGYVGFKTWANTKRGATAVFNLFDADNGRLLAAMEAAVLGQLRTSGISGVATRRMAAEDADTMALIGTGAQAITQVAAVNAVRPLKCLKVFSPTAEKRQAFVARAREAFPFAIEEAGSVEACVADQPIVTTITRSSDPFLTADMLARGTHLNAVGAILPQKAEFTQDVFDRADLVIVDNLPNAKLASSEFIDRFEKGPGDWQKVRTLSAAIVEGLTRPATADLSIFKAMGMGISDLCIAKAAYERAVKQRLGLKIPSPVRVAPQWRRATGTQAAQ
ncbi:ornithine cyclodeaminase family protein [Oceanibacterium hippocampi]|uniref:L-lysine cyclodeaminase n=1 Tax=Oceanibacterium hippocampi TaxID=745714 RepID=A0A1Y5RCQ0_9PROT|nr:ornithine cyclodeaminase family protein [Oceanibacterium hippocampi]SLN13147.1 L-lysine cyclodeaminase [Oceanibacterium hippocampi]